MTPDPTPPPTGCAAFGATVQAVLDRELGADALDGGHPAGCPDCRALAAAAKRLLAGTAALRTAPPPGLADRLVSVAVRDYRVRRRRRIVGRAVFAALAASVLIAGVVYLSSPSPKGGQEMARVPPGPTPAPEHTPGPQEPAAPRFSDRVAEAGSAFAALTRKATDQTITPTRDLLPPPGTVSLPAEALPGVEPAAESLAGMPRAARSGIEPVADKTRRAVNLFLRDVGVGTPAKPKL